jgi:hypothetical protein
MGLSKSEDGKVWNRTGDGHPVMVGATRSGGISAGKMATPKVQEPAFPELSTASSVIDTGHCCETMSVVVDEGRTRVVSGKLFSTTVMVAETTWTLSVALRGGSVTLMSDVSTVGTETVTLGHTTTGGVTSNTVTARAQLAVLPEASDAVHSTGVTPTGNLKSRALLLTLQLIELTTSLSEAATLKPVAVKGDGEYVEKLEVAKAVNWTSLHCNSGGVTSRTLTVVVQELVLPLESEAVQISTVVPNENVVYTTPCSSVELPAALPANDVLQLRVASPELSAALTAKPPRAVVPVKVALRFSGGGQTICGLSPSKTSTLKLQDAVLGTIAVSRTEHVTRVLPSWYVEPDGSEHIGEPESATLSEAVTRPE